jgi:hypothetical protein
MIHYPLRILIKQRGARMNVDLLVIRYCPITFLRVLTPCMGEETCTDRLPNAGVVLICEDATGEDRELKTVHDCN